jgi:hypothetical protein
MYTYGITSTSRAELFRLLGSYSEEKTMAHVPVYTENSLTVHGVTATVVTWSIASLTSTNMTGGTGPEGYDPPGFVSNPQPGCPHHHQRGHLVGNKLGGRGIEGNLVTLTNGSNHPVMYEFEAWVYEYVKSKPGQTFYYEVQPRYRSGEYTVTPNLPMAIAGASGNPYCPFPCPESLLIFFYDGAGQHPLSWKIPTEAKEGNAVVIKNGVYKFHEGSVKHVAKGCFAA